MIEYRNIADLHVHTTASDGAYSLPEVARLARDAGLEIIGVTDHDNVSAIGAERLINGVEIIPGVELSADWGAREAHILGYYIDPRDRELCERLNALQEKRRERLAVILQKLNDLKVDIDPQEILDMAAGGSVGRLHVAERLIDKGYAGSLYEAFRDFLGPEGKAFVPKTRMSVHDAIGLIHAAGGAAALAHPGFIFAPDEIREFARWGLDGIEAYYPRHSQSDITQALKLAEELDLVVTGGSDFHGRYMSDIAIGATRVTADDVARLHERSKRYGAGRIS